MDSSQQPELNRDRIKAAVEALRGGNPGSILPAVDALTHTEVTVVAIVIEMTSAPTKPKRGRPAGSKSKGPLASLAVLSPSEHRGEGKAS